MEPMAEQRGRLAMMEGQLAVLQARYELAISAFKFDEANTLQAKDCRARSGAAAPG
jgi:hypothetical protein